MTEFLKNSEPIGMNFRKFVTMSMNFADLGMQGLFKISSVVIKLLKRYPSTRINVKTEPFMCHPYEQHIQFHLTIKYPPPTVYLAEGATKSDKDQRVTGSMQHNQGI